MPLYEYELLEGDCKVCKGRFELRRPSDRAPLTSCPLCKKPVRKIPSLPNTPKWTRKVGVAEAKQAGFTILEKKDSGIFERK